MSMKPGKFSINFGDIKVLLKMLENRSEEIKYWEIQQMFWFQDRYKYFLLEVF